MLLNPHNFGENIKVTDMTGETISDILKSDVMSTSK